MARTSGGFFSQLTSLLYRFRKRGIPVLGIDSAIYCDSEHVFSPKTRNQKRLRLQFAVITLGHINPGSLSHTLAGDLPRSRRRVFLDGDAAFQNAPRTFLGEIVGLNQVAFFHIPRQKPDLRLFPRNHHEFFTFR